MGDQKEYNRKLIEDFRASRGASDDPFAGRPLLLLTTTGAKSGQRRTTPLMYVPDGDRLLIIASNAGAPKHPNWYRNLLEYPDVAVEVGADISTPLLDAVERANLFLLLLDAERHIYRYHDLFAKALRARLWREQPELARTVHRRATAWYVAEGMLADAVPHLFVIGELDQAADLIGQLAESLLLRGEVATILHWLNALPDALIHARLPLIQARIFAQITTGQITSLEADVYRLAAAPGKGDNTPALQVLTAMLHDADPRVQQQLQQALITPAEAPPADQDVLLYQGFAHWAHGAVAPARTALQLAARRHIATTR